MQRALLVTVRLHDGRYHGRDYRKADEWPPAPARLFQALMAGAARGAVIPATTRAALDWLESLPPPVIAAPRGSPGQSFTCFVPNNDLDAELKKGQRLEEAVAKVRVGKRVQPILFDADIPILYCWAGWPIGVDEEHAAAVCMAVDRLHQLGRGVDMAWASAETLDAEDAARRLAGHGGIVYRPSVSGGPGHGLLCPGPGLRRGLEIRFAGMRARLHGSGTRRKRTQVFVQPPKPRLVKISYDAPPRRFVFEVRSSGPRAEFSARLLNDAASFVCAARDAAAERLRLAAPQLTEAVDRYLVGRGAEAGDKDRRVRLVPIPSIGSEHADMMIRRLAVYVPQTCGLEAGDVAWAFSEVAARHDADDRIGDELQRVDDDRMVRRFEQRARGWRSVTPLALPAARRRRIDPARQADDAKGGIERAREEARAVAAVHHALRHAETGAPLKDVRVQREPFDSHGARAEWFASKTRFPKETLWHVAVTFAERVPGPLLLGDGRFIGLGLMRPDDPNRGVLAFSITGGLAAGANPFVVARAARRAMMARVQRRLTRGETLPSYVSGHEQDGAPAGDGVHRHVAVVVDPPRERLLFIAPTRLQRRGVDWKQIEKNHRLTVHALEGMDVLRAGPAGRLTLNPAVVDTESDPLFAPARVWESVTTYQVTRHRLRSDDEDTLRADVGLDLERRGWPKPKSVDVLAVQRGPRGAVYGRVRFTFRTAQPGPLLIGRTAHKGGGLFTGRH